MKPLAELDQVAVLWRPPFAAGGAQVMTFSPSTTLAEMVAAHDMLPIDFDRRGTILIGEHIVSREKWPLVRVKAGQRITFHYALGGPGGEGGGGGKKAILGVVLAIATILTAGAAAAFGAPMLGIAGGSLGANLLGGAISIIGALASSAIAATPAKPERKSQADNSRGAASASGNLLAPGAAIPRVIGTRRIFPPLAAQPLVSRVGPDEIVEAVFALAGPHSLADIRIGDVLIEDAEDVEVETREGWPTDAPIDSVQRYGVTRSPNIELSPHAVDPDVQDRLENQIDALQSIPKWHAVTSSADADEVWLHMTLPEGLYDPTADTAKQTIPFRLRMRKLATDPWINLPEIHFTSKAAKEVRIAILLKWADGPTPTPAVPQFDGWSAAYTSVGGQAAPQPATDGWTAHSSFSSGGGSPSNILYTGVEAASGVRRVSLSNFTATFHLDAASIPQGAYQIEIKRGICMATASFSTSAYTYSGNARDLFHYILSGTEKKIIRSREGLSERVYLLRAASVINDHPVFGGESGSGLSLIAVKARNRALENLSVVASGYVKDWDGTGWNDWTTTSNPAPHYRDVMRGDLAPDPLELELIDEASLVAWRAACITEGYTCDYICEGDSGEEVMTILAGCGFARPRASEKWGVMLDYDRSGEDPVQVFTSRNSSSLSMAKAFPRLPDAFRAIWQDPDNLDAENQITVWRRGREGAANPRIEEVRYEGMTSEAAVQTRAAFDLAQAELRSAFWSFQAPVEALRAARGDLIEVNHNVLDRMHASARIADVEVEGGEIVAVWLDSVMPGYSEPDWFAVTDFFAVEDVFLLGLTTSMGIRRSDGLTSYHPVTVVTGEWEKVRLTTPVALDLDDDGLPFIREDCLVFLGRPGFEARRMIIVSATYDRDFKASITAVDEAPELWAA